MQVPPALHALVQQRVDPHASREQRLQQLVRLAFDADGLDLQYDAKATHSVAESYATRRVNCLSFTLLFVVLARDAGLDAQVQEVGRVLSWYQDGDALYNAGHVNVGVRIDGRRGSIDLDRSVLMDRRGPRPISDRRALAHYYNNRGAELMADGALPAAQQHLAMALQMDRDFAAAWNNLGVLALRQGDTQAAAQDYATALAVDPGHVSTLSNAASLYRRLGDSRREAAMLARLQRVQLTDPFHQYLLGNEAERRQDYAAAIGYYRHALRLYDGAHLLYFALARAYLLSGDQRRAHRAMQQALEHADSGAQPRYQTKLDALRRLSHNTQARR
ncbi:tetratricopeptide repeat protein [Xanthomonas sp. AM6]|uniref:tetratricopeptide repeat protein n=1 Tax=Xanthomonas sp. AM6 TaxID=2982531 RepID=UPI0021D8E9EC|nr:tetratricopeptide repeat protein [Xanthomonas sp. AM6]UYB51001.1 tetratricopeptide repeat protein [Xanthomonas sp. AM6]